MPELPEVETTVRELSKVILGRKIEDVWSDTWDITKKEVGGRKIERIKRRGKNILLELSGGKTLLIHQKLTGHLLYGFWTRKQGQWKPPTGPLSDKVNTYIHLLFTLDNGKMIALSDLRKFAKVELWDKKKLEDSPEFKKIGPEPLEKTFTFEKFKKAIQRARGKIKQVLMDQAVIAGIGNIYSDEILFKARIHPLKDVSRLSDSELERIYQAMKNILSLAVKLQGESFSDYRVPSGAKGFYDKARKVYRKEGEKCPDCGTKIERIKLGGRSAHFCPSCQKL